MLINEYQLAALRTAIYGTGDSIVYPTLGLAGEAGEVANKVKKILRDKNGLFSGPDREVIADELGDVLWYCAALARDLGFTLDEICINNIDKLKKRQATNTVRGSGDDRHKTK